MYATIGVRSTDEGHRADELPRTRGVVAAVLLVGGVHGREQSADAIVREVAGFEALPQNQRRFRLLDIPIASPDAQPQQFPPVGAAYHEHVESLYVLRIEAGQWEA